MTKLLTDLTPEQKATAIWRTGQTLLLIIMTVGFQGMWSKASSVSDKIDQQSHDIAQIKYQFESLRETAKNDKNEVLRQIDNLEKRMQAFREEAATDRSEINKIRTEIALLKQKIQMP